RAEQLIGPVANHHQKGLQEQVPETAAEKQAHRDEARQQQNQEDRGQRVQANQRPARVALQESLGPWKHQIEVQADRRQQYAAHDENQQQYRLRRDPPPMESTHVRPYRTQRQPEEKRSRAVERLLPEYQHRDH